MAYVYIHKNKINGKQYCGITKQKPERRWGKDGSRYLQKRKDGKYIHPIFAPAIIKYGWNNFEHIILFSDITIEEAQEKEREIVESLKLNNPQFDYNACAGGGCPPDCSKEKNAFFGKRPDKAIEASAAARKGKHLSDKHKKKISEGNKGKEKNTTGLKEHNTKISRKIICVETNQIFESVQETARAFNGSAGSLVTQMKKNQKFNGYTFKHLDT